MFKYCRSNSKGIGCTFKMYMLAKQLAEFSNVFCNQVCRLFKDTGLT